MKVKHSIFNVIFTNRYKNDDSSSLIVLEKWSTTRQTGKTKPQFVKNVQSSEFFVGVHQRHEGGYVVSGIMGFQCRQFEVKEIRKCLPVLIGTTRTSIEGELEPSHGMETGKQKTRPQFIIHVRRKNGFMLHMEQRQVARLCLT